MSRLVGRTTARLAAPVTAVTLAVALGAPAFADWEEPVGTANPVNQSPARNATNSDLTTIDGVPYVVWNEDTTQGSAGRSSTIRVARLADDGSAWEKVANAGTHPISRLSSTSSENPSIAEVDGRPWVAWEEGLTATNSEIRVARLNTEGTAWVRTPDTLRPVNHLREDPGGQASYPTIVGDGSDRPYVSFFESDPGSGSLFFGDGQDPAKIWVMRLSADGTTWEEVGGGHVNPLADFDAAFPRMTLVDGVPWVTYFQVEVVDGSPSIGVRVSRLGASGTWEQVGDPVLSGGPGAVENPDIAAIAGRPHVAAPATLGDPNPRVRVFALDEAGTGWTGLGAASPSGAEATDVSLEAIGGLPWVSWQQRAGASDVGVSVLRDGAWEQVGTAYRHGTDGDVRHGPALADVNGFPWFSFSQHDGQSPGSEGVEPCCKQLRVARLEPDFGSSSSQPTDDSATLLSSVSDYGLPFPVGFEYGPAGSFGSSSAPAPSGDASLFYRIISGLAPSTLYGFRPYATAGTPEPRVRGSESFFVTDPPSGSELPLIVAITNARDRVRQGNVYSVRYITTRPGKAVLRIRRDGRLIASRERTVEAGLRAFRWRAQAPPGRYRVRLAFRGAGERAVDGTFVRVLRR